jgi:hypothetical protein
MFEILAAAVSFLCVDFYFAIFFGEKAWENCGFSV